MIPNTLPVQSHEPAQVLCSYIKPVCAAATTHAVRCVPAQVVSDLKAAGALHHTSIVVAMDGAPLGEQYAALCLACSIGGERGLVSCCGCVWAVYFIGGERGL